jgi:hypothetical protein
MFLLQQRSVRIFFRFLLQHYSRRYAIAFFQMQ